MSGIIGRSFRSRASSLNVVAKTSTTIGAVGRFSNLMEPGTLDVTRRASESTSTNYIVPAIHAIRPHVALRCRQFDGSVRSFVIRRKTYSSIWGPTPLETRPCGARRFRVRQPQRWLSPSRRSKKLAIPYRRAAQEIGRLKGNAVQMLRSAAAAALTYQISLSAPR